MIRLILTGGLGNQMFEYAAAKSLALRLNEKLTIDLYALNKKTKGSQRSFELDVFDIDFAVSSSCKTKFIVKAFPWVEKNRQLFKQLFGYFRDGSAIVYRPEFEELKENTILHGYFQNEAYFKNFEDIIRKEFTFKRPLTGENVRLSKQLTNENSVAIHIRRGDYLTDGNFALCTPQYYQRAIEEIYEKIKDPTFHIFSQDFEWVNENIKFEDNSSVRFIDWNKGEDSYIDMQLMSLCKHNIIANSSFSWWGAWLNNNPEKIVLAPTQWFAEEKRNEDLKNFYPQGWEIIG